MTTWTAQLVSVDPQSAGPPTFDTVEDLRFGSLTVVDEVAGPGGCDVTVSVDGLGSGAKDRLRDALATLAAACEVWVWRDGVQVFAGPLVGLSGEIRRAVTLTAQGPLAYLGWMCRSTPYKVTDRDQALIVADLVGDAQDQTYGDVGLDLSMISETGVLRQLTLATGDPVDRHIAEMGARTEGFDLWVDPASRHLMVVSPYRGRDLSASVIVDDRQLLDGSWSAMFGPGQVATEAFAQSAAPGGAKIVSRAENATLVSLAGRKQTAGSFTDVTRKATLDAHAAQLTADLSAPVVQVTSTLVPVDVSFGSVQAGDVVMFDSDLGLGATSSARRISRVQVDVTSAGERLSVEFV